MSGARTPEWEVLVGDCREQIKEIPDESVDSVVTDPPYELGFMGKKWDSSGIAYDVALWREVLRVLKPGGHLLAFGGSRTYHRMACAIEDAGFEVRDSLMWLYGTGFPKSLDVSKAIDKDAGVERSIIGSVRRPKFSKGRGYERGSDGEVVYRGFNGGHNGSAEVNISTAGSDAAKRWSGYGTTLKPAHEPVVMARKPLIGTVAANVMQYGTGVINVDGCRIGKEKRTPGYMTAEKKEFNPTSYGMKGHTEVNTNEGRWPANVLLDEEAAELLDAQSGERSSGSRAPGARKGMGFHSGASGDGGLATEGSSGGASRFFKVIKEDQCETVNIARAASNQPGQVGGFVPKDALISDCQEVPPNRPGEIRSVSMNETPKESKANGEINTKTILCSDKKYLPASMQQSMEDRNVLVSNAEVKKPIDTTTITTNRSNLDGSVAAVTFKNTSKSKEVGDLVSGSSFIYTAKASRSEREAGCEGLPPRTGAEAVDREEGSAGLANPRAGAGRTAKVVRNHHTTVKPISLMRYLVRLVTPPGGLILDPFGGSGTTGCAAVLEGFDCLLIERELEYVEIIKARVAHWAAKGSE